MVRITNITDKINYQNSDILAFKYGLLDARHYLWIP